MLLCKFGKLENFCPRSLYLGRCVLAWPVVNEIQRKLAQVGPHLNDARMHIIPHLAERDRSCNLQERIRFFKKPLGDGDTATCTRTVQLELYSQSPKRARQPEHAVSATTGSHGANHRVTAPSQFGGWAIISTRQFDPAHIHIHSLLHFHRQTEVFVAHFDAIVGVANQLHKTAEHAI